MATFNFSVSAVAAPSTTGSVLGEKKHERKARMAATLASDDWKVVYSVGRLLSMPVNEAGQSGAAVIAAGGSFPIESLVVNGVTLETIPGTTISLENLSTWACHVCGKASGLKDIEHIDIALLASNQFYYVPATKALFVISPSCWDNHIGGTVHTKQFTVPQAPVSTPTKAKR